jgi:flavorubredoxin
MSVELTPTVEWLPQCYPHGGDDGDDQHEHSDGDGHHEHGDDFHEHVSVYLVRAEDGDVLIDSGSVYHREEVRASVDAATGEAGLDALVLSHSDYPHAGNVTPLGAASDEVELVASSGSPAQQGLPEARQISIGDEEVIRGRRFSFVDPPLADRSHTTWIYDHADGVLFTADGFGAYHPPDRCEATSADFGEGIPTEAVSGYHRDNLVWLRYVDPGKIRRALGDIFETYDVRAIAPVHGPPVVGGDVGPYLERFYETAERVADGYEVDV